MNDGAVADVLAYFRGNPTTSTRVAAKLVDEDDAKLLSSRSTIQRILKVDI
jgi:hypothetical protein